MRILLLFVAVVVAFPVTVRAGETAWQSFKTSVAEFQSLADQQAPGESSMEHAIKWGKVEPLIFAQWKNCMALVGRYGDEFDLQECKAEHKSLRAQARKLLGRKLIYSANVDVELGEFNFKTKKYPLVLRPLHGTPTPNPCESAVANGYICLFQKKPGRQIINGTGGLYGVTPMQYWYFRAKPLITYTEALPDTETAKSFKAAWEEKPGGGGVSGDVFFRWSNPRNKNCAKPTKRRGRKIPAHCWGRVEVIEWPDLTE